MKTAILGGGLTGLTLGYFLGQKGVDFDILEKENECGGLMRSLQENGYTFDFGGSHIIFSKDTKILDMMTYLLGDNKIKNKRNTKIFYKNQYIKYPFENGLSDLPKEDNFECLYYFIKNLIRREKCELDLPRNLQEWFYSTFGKGIADKYLIPYNEKIWKFPIERISLEWVERIPNPPIEDIIKSSLGIETEGYVHQINFYYPRTGGIQSLIRSLQENMGPHIVTGFDVKRVCKERERWIISNGQEERSYDKIVSTIPIHDLIDALDAPDPVRTAAKNLKYNSLITVMIGLLSPNINNDLTWIYIPDKDVITHRVSFPSNYSPDVAPEGRSSILSEITCNIGDSLWRMDERAITKRVIDDLHRLRLINRDEVCFSKVKKIKYAYVISDLDYQENIRKIEKYMQKIGIDRIGRFSEFKYLNMDDCIRSVLEYLMHER